MGKNKIPVTPAIRMLRDDGVLFTEHPYAYEEKGGTAVCARELDVDEHAVIKTLVMQDERGSAFLVLMHGDREVSTRNLARIMGVKSVSPCAPEVAFRQTGYTVGGISPFGTRKPLPVYMEKTILGLTKVYINGGRKGLLVGLDPCDLMRVLVPVPVNAAQES